MKQTKKVKMLIVSNSSTASDVVHVVPLSLSYSEPYEEGEIYLLHKINVQPMNKEKVWGKHDS